jgi:hypothetical protein
LSNSTPKSTWYGKQELGRHDDIISLFYMLVEFTIGQLPWRKLKEKEVVGKKKAEYDHGLFLKELPSELGPIWHHLQELTYIDKPDYSFLLSQLHKAIIGRGYKDMDPFDWEKNSVKGSGISISQAEAMGGANSDKKKAQSKGASRATSFGLRGQPTPLGAVKQVTSQSPQSVGSLQEDVIEGHIDKKEDAYGQKSVHNTHSSARSNSKKQTEAIETQQQQQSEATNSCQQQQTASIVTSKNTKLANNSDEIINLKGKENQIELPTGQKAAIEKCTSPRLVVSQSHSTSSSSKSSSISSSSDSSSELCSKSSSESCDSHSKPKSISKHSSASKQQLLVLQPRPPPGRAKHPCVSARMRRFHLKPPAAGVT